MNTTANDDALSIPTPAKPATPSAPIKQPPLDEVTSAYLQHRSALEGRAALAAQLAEDPIPATSSRPVNQPPLDEIGPAYIEHRESLEGRAALQALLSEGAPAAAATATP